MRQDLNASRGAFTWAYPCACAELQAYDIVSDAAVQQAALVLGRMMEGLPPAMRARQRAAGFKLAIIGAEQVTHPLPPYLPDMASYGMPLGPPAAERLVPVARQPLHCTARACPPAPDLWERKVLANAELAGAWAPERTLASAAMPVPLLRSVRLPSGLPRPPPRLLGMSWAGEKPKRSLAGCVKGST